MKTIILTLVSLLTAMTCVLGQNLISNSSFKTATLNNFAQLNLPDGQNFDNNGVPSNNNSTLLKAPYVNRSILTANTYDSARALTEINDLANADAYPWISPDGLRLYYTSGANSNKLMFTQRPNYNSNFVSPIIIPIPISISTPASYWFSANELDLYICISTTMYFAHRNTISSSFNAPILLNLSGASLSYIKSASLDTAQNKLFLYSNTLGIVELIRTSPTSFAYVRTLILPTGYFARAGQLSKDELSFFLGATDYSGKDKLYQLTRTTPTDSFSISTFQQIQGINDTSILFNTQPSMSDNLDWVAFTRADTTNWVGNDLYIANKGTTINVFNPMEQRIVVSVFPNPTRGDFKLKISGSILNESEEGLFEIYNSMGEKVYFYNKFNYQTSNEIDFSIASKGIYFVKIYNGKEIHTEKIIVQ